MYSSKLGPYLLANRPGCQGVARQTRAGFTLEFWDEADGEPPSEAEVEAWDPAGSVTDVERLAAASTNVFIDKRREATLYLDKVKGEVHAALVFSGKYDNAAATTEGVKFVECHTVSLTTFKDCGGHPLAAQRLLAAIMSEGSKSLFDWLDIPAVAAVFENSLTY